MPLGDIHLFHTSPRCFHVINNIYIYIYIFWQITEQNTGSPPLDEVSIDEESTWIHSQLATGTIPLFGKRGRGTPKDGWDLSINKADSMRFLDLLHVQKLDVSILLSKLVSALCLI
jgi:hypothetical protein